MEIGRARTLHRNFLLPIGSICIELDQHHRISKLKPAPKKRIKHIDTPETFTVTYDVRGGGDLLGFKNRL